MCMYKEKRFKSYFKAICLIIEICLLYILYCFLAKHQVPYLYNSVFCSVSTFESLFLVYCLGRHLTSCSICRILSYKDTHFHLF